MEKYYGKTLALWRDELKRREGGTVGIDLDKKVNDMVVQLKIKPDSGNLRSGKFFFLVYIFLLFSLIDVR